MKSPEDVPSVSIVVPVHDGGARFLRCLENLRALRPPPLEVVVVADGDTDGSARVAKEAGARVVRLPRAQGPAAARNRGAKEAGGEVLLFVDADVAVAPDAVSLVAAAFGADPGLAACFGSYDDEPSEPNLLSQYKNLQHHWVHQTGNDAASTFWAGCGAVRRCIFEEAGGFDERYRKPSVEDIELGYRLRRSGHSIRILKDLRATHLKRWTLRSHLEAEFFGRALPWTELILAEGRFIDDLNVTVKSRLSVALACLLALTAPMALARHGLWPLPAVAATALLGLNGAFYRFLVRKRGALFLAKALPWHWLHFFYSGLAFGLGLARSRLRGTAGAAPSADNIARHGG
ncbi:MAG: glycosyltransferase family 2 protein [Deltaproteobacteria bacterium]|nr:glycosyltransferase family 2 protein [Deltaproteobacteria bacterium]